MVETNPTHRAHLARQMSQIPETSISNPGRTNIAIKITATAPPNGSPDAIPVLRRTMPAKATIDPQMLA